MNSTKKTYLFLLGFIILIPLSFDNNLININALHRSLFSLLCFLLSFLFLFSRKSPKPIYINKIFLVAAILFPVCLVISSVVNGKIILLYEDLSLLINLLSFSFLVIILSSQIDEKVLLKFISTLIVIAGLIVSIIGLLQLFGLNILNLIPNPRPGSTLGIRNFASEYLIGVIPFAFISLIICKSKRVKIIFLFVIICVMSYLFLLRSRAAYVTLLISLIFFVTLLIIFYKKNNLKINLKKDLSLITLALIISLLIGFFQPTNIDKERENLQTTVASVFDTDYAPNIARIKYYKTSFEMFKENPLLGIGTGAWFGLYPKYNSEDYTDGNIFFTANLNPHNDFLEILTENGIIGFLLFITLIVLSIIKLIKHCNKNIYFIALTASFISIIIISLFSFPKDNTSVMILFFLAIALANSAYTFHNAGNKGQLKINFKLLSLVLSLIILVTVPYNLLRYKYEKNYLSAMFDKAEGRYSNMNEKLENIANEIYPTEPNKMPLSYYKGVGFFQEEKYEMALENFQDALDITPYVPQILSNTATSFYMLNDVENAESVLLDLKQTFPNYIEPQVNLLAIYTNTGKDSLATSLINELDDKNLQPESIKNFSVFTKIKKHYNEKSFN